MNTISPPKQETNLTMFGTLDSSESQKIYITQQVYDEKGRGRPDNVKKENSPYKYMWQLYIINNKTHRPLIDAVQSIREILLKSEGEIDEVPEERGWGHKDKLLFEVYAKSADSLCQIVDDIIDNAEIDRDNLYDRFGSKFSIDFLRGCIEDLDTRLGRS